MIEHVPPEIVFTIAKYTKPNPETYCCAALVSRSFYEVFTSDKVWEPLNIYGVEKGIINDYLKPLGPVEICGMSIPSPKRTVNFWANDYKRQGPRPYGMDKFDWLGFLVCNRHPNPDSFNGPYDETFLKCLWRLDRQAYKAHIMHNWRWGNVEKADRREATYG